MMSLITGAPKLTIVPSVESEGKDSAPLSSVEEEEGASEVSSPRACEVNSGAVRGAAKAGVTVAMVARAMIADERILTEGEGDRIVLKE